MNCYKAIEGACSRGHLSVIKLLVEHQPQIIELASSGASPCLLHAAILCARRGKLDVLSFLLEKGVDPNAHPPESACPLATALKEDERVAYDRYRVLEILLKAGADVNNSLKLRSSNLLPTMHSTPMSAMILARKFSNC